MCVHVYGNTYICTYVHTYELIYTYALKYITNASKISWENGIKRSVDFSIRIEIHAQFFHDMHFM